MAQFVVEIWDLSSRAGHCQILYSCCLASWHGATILELYLCARVVVTRGTAASTDRASKCDDHYSPTLRNLHACLLAEFTDAQCTRATCWTLGQCVSVDSIMRINRTCCLSQPSRPRCYSGDSSFRAARPVVVHLHGQPGPQGLATFRAQDGGPMRFCR